jgi:hypothetical protein
MAERNEFTGIDYARGSVKHPFIAFLLASARMIIFSFRHFGKPMMVDYRTGEVWEYRG